MHLYYCIKNDMLDPIPTAPSISCFVYILYKIILAITCFNSGMTCFD